MTAPDPTPAPVLKPRVREAIPLGINALDWTMGVPATATGGISAFSDFNAFTLITALPSVGISDGGSRLVIPAGNGRFTYLRPYATTGVAGDTFTGRVWGLNTRSGNDPSKKQRFISYMGEPICAFTATLSNLLLSDPEIGTSFRFARLINVTATKMIMVDKTTLQNPDALGHGVIVIGTDGAGSATADYPMTLALGHSPGFAYYVVELFVSASALGLNAMVA